MKVVVGLGNPGGKYEGTRHNVGFAVLEELARRHAFPQSRTRFEAKVTEQHVLGDKLLLVAPQTYMNLSGRSVRALFRFFQLDFDNLLVVCDDMNLPTASLRLRGSGSSGGQKGLQNIIDQLGTQEFARLRLGVGRPRGAVDTTDHVLSRFRSAEAEQMQEAIGAAADAVEMWIEHGTDYTMNRVN